MQSEQWDISGKQYYNILQHWTVLMFSFTTVFLLREIYKVRLHTLSDLLTLYPLPVAYYEIIKGENTQGN